MASLFGVNQVRERAKAIPTESVAHHIEVVKTWHNDYHHGSLKKDNETAREQAYNQDFFVGILGYKQKPATPFSFEPKASTDTGQIPDARIGTFDPATNLDDTVAVVELKGASIALDRPQRGHGNYSPVQQGFKYRPQYRGCSFVIVSNFFEVRLYNDNQLDFESWTLDDLVDPKEDYLRFKTFYLLLHADRMLRVEGRSQTQDFLSDIRVNQDRIGRDFYANYSDAREKLLRSLWLLNPTLQDDPDKWIEKGQKIIDRVVFACFAEDRGLLPDNTLQRIGLESKNSALSMWNMIKAFFDGIDKGDTKLGIPVGYNGGLFARDDELDALQVGESSLQAVVALGNYNFEEDLSVNILGHIFEQSISDLDRIREGVAEGGTAETIQYSRRRNEGIYYTPEHIVRYIVDHALGARLRELEDQLIEKHGLKGDILDATYTKREKAAYVEYREALNNIRVVDPACGSGAFLVTAFDFLLAEHRRVAAILDDLYSNSAFVSSILQNNLYGVDLNEESVEITKLSLWLKTAAKGEKLTSLDGNIKSGNSVKVSAEPGNGNAFLWREEFGDVFEAGGFDAVIGNPPYIREAVNRSAFNGLRDNPVFQGKMDIWTMFGWLGLDIAKRDVGRVGFIAPSNWITNAGASKFRDCLVQLGRIQDYVDFGDYMVFEDAAIQTMIFTLRRTADNDTYSFPFGKLLSRSASQEEVTRFLVGELDDHFERFQATIIKEQAAGKTLNMNPASFDDLLTDIARVGTERLGADEVATGIDVHQDFLNRKGAAKLGNTIAEGSGIFIVSDAERGAMQLNAAEKDLVRPYYTTDELRRYVGNKQHSLWVIYTGSAHRTPAAMSPYPHVKAHLDRFEKVITSDNAPYGLHRAREEQFFQGEHIISLRKAARPTFTYVDFDAYVSQTFFVIKTSRWNVKALTAILNSTLVAFWLHRRGKMQGGQYQIDKAPILGIPLVIPLDQAELAGLTDAIVAGRRKLTQDQRLLEQALVGAAREWIQECESWWKLTSQDRSDSLPTELTAKQRSDVLELLNDKVEGIADVAKQVEEAEAAVDQIVYDLYELSNEQVQMIRDVTPAASRRS